MNDNKAENYLIFIKQFEKTIITPCNMRSYFRRRDFPNN